MSLACLRSWVSMVSDLSHHQVGDGLSLDVFFLGGDFPGLGSGQIIATSRDLTPNGGLVREISYFREIWVGETL